MGKFGKLEGLLNSTYQKLVKTLHRRQVLSMVLGVCVLTAFFTVYFYVQKAVMLCMGKSVDTRDGFYSNNIFWANNIRILFE